MFVQTYVPYRLCPDLAKTDVSQGSLYALLRDHYGLAIASGKRLVEAVSAHTRVSGLLEVRSGAPLLKIESVSPTSKTASLSNITQCVAPSGPQSFRASKWSSESPRLRPAWLPHRDGLGIRPRFVGREALYS